MPTLVYAPKKPRVRHSREQPASPKDQQLVADTDHCTNKRKLEFNQEPEKSNKKRNGADQASHPPGDGLADNNQASRREEDESEVPRVSTTESDRVGMKSSSSTISPTQLQPSPASFVADLVNCILHPHSTSSQQVTPPALIVLLAIKKLQAHTDTSKTFEICALELAYSGVYLAVVEAMKHHHSHVAVQMEAIKLLWKCSVNDRACRRALRQLGVVHLVTKAIKTHSDNVAIHQMGYGLLSELILEHHETLGDVSDLLQVVPFAISVLETRMDNAKYIKRITIFLMSMLRIEHDTTKKAILGADGLKIIFDAMQKGNEESQQRVRDLMKALL